MGFALGGETCKLGATYFKTRPNVKPHPLDPIQKKRHENKFSQLCNTLA